MKQVSKEEPFSVMAHSFAVSPSSENYILNYSVDGVNFTAWEKATTAGDNLIATGFPKGLIYKLVGNNSDVEVIF